MSALISPKGVALQFYLIALFQMQCRYLPGMTPVNDIPLRASIGGQEDWLSLVVSPAAENYWQTKEKATARDNRLRQLKQALQRLDKVRLIQLNGNQGSRRSYEGFKLMDEAGTLPPTPYRIPRAWQCLDLPISFFTRGWIYTLSPAEIATYLMLRHLARSYPDNHAGDGIYIAGSKRELAYGLSRDVYESHHLLARYRLVRLIRADDRHSDGKVINFSNKSPNDLQPYRFKVLDDASLDRNAYGVVMRALERSINRRAE